jgi:transcriptional regulator with XRE-family HTH domain
MKGGRMKKLETHDWWPKLLELKDDLSLQELAEHFGVTATSVSRALKRNGISRKRTPPDPRAQRKEELPPEPGERPAKAKSSAPAKTSSHRRKSKAHLIERYEHLLGVRSDREVAELAGVSSNTVANYRSRAGIPAARRATKREATEANQSSSKPKKATRKGKGRKRKARASKVDPFFSLLGEVPDRVVAEKAGVTLGAVLQYRKRHGVPAYGRKASAPAIPSRPAPAPAPAPSAKGADSPSPSKADTLAWRATLATGDVMVVAAKSLTAAASRAATLGDVVSLERVGPLV